MSSLRWYSTADYRPPLHSRITDMCLLVDLILSINNSSTWGDILADLVELYRVKLLFLAIRVNKRLI